MKTVFHAYKFDISTPEGKADYTALRVRLKARGLECFETWGGGSHYKPELDGRTIELETKHLFNNQWNTAPIDGVTEKGLRVFDWAQDAAVGDFPKWLKRGHYLEQTPEMREIRRNTAVCGYCGKQEPAAKGYVFCPHCLDSPYLGETDLHLTRMLPVDENGPRANRAPLTEAERAYLLPLYKAAQISGSTERGRARAVKLREDIEKSYRAALAAAESKRTGALWLCDNCPQILENWIFYPHTGRHCFGWRKPLGEAELSAFLDVVTEFPEPYDIKCADGRTLSGD